MKSHTQAHEIATGSCKCLRMSHDLKSSLDFVSDLGDDEVKDGDTFCDGFGGYSLVANSAMQTLVFGQGCSLDIKVSPACFIPVEKNYGCNFVICPICNATFVLMVHVHSSN